MRILLHDYAGHPFQFELSRALAARGHYVYHAYFKGDMGPKGSVRRTNKDPSTFWVLPIEISTPYYKHKFISRWRNDNSYGVAVAHQIKHLAPDVVMSSNTPLDSQERIIAACKASNAKFVNWVQDFYGLAIERLISNHWMGMGAHVARRYRNIERRQLMASDHVVLISEGFTKYLPRSLQQSDRTSVIPNWAPIRDLPILDRSNGWSREHGVDKKFVFLYTGTLGLKHNPGLLLSLADEFAQFPEVEILVTATGIGRDRLVASLQSNPRQNLRVMPLQPFDIFPQVLASADVLVALLETDAGEFSVPSKVQSYLCAGRPILLSAPDSNLAAEIVAKTNAGLVVEPDDLKGFLAAAKRLYEGRALRSSLGANGRAYAEQYFDIERIADRFEEILTGVQQREDEPVEAELPQAMSA